MSQGADYAAYLRAVATCQELPAAAAVASERASREGEALVAAAAARERGARDDLEALTQRLSRLQAATTMVAVRAGLPPGAAAVPAGTNAGTPAPETLEDIDRLLHGVANDLAAADSTSGWLERARRAAPAPVPTAPPLPQASPALVATIKPPEAPPSASRNRPVLAGAAAALVVLLALVGFLLTHR